MIKTFSALAVTAVLLILTPMSFAAICIKEIGPYPPIIPTSVCYGTQGSMKCAKKVTLPMKFSYKKNAHVIIKYRPAAIEAMRTIVIPANKIKNGDYIKIKIKHNKLLPLEKNTGSPCQ